MNAKTKRNIPFKGYHFAPVARSSRIGIKCPTKEIVRESANVEAKK